MNAYGETPKCGAYMSKSKSIIYLALAMKRTWNVPLPSSNLRQLDCGDTTGLLDKWACETGEAYSQACHRLGESLGVALIQVVISS